MIIYSNRNKSFKLILQVKFVMNDLFHKEKHWSEPMIKWQFSYVLGTQYIMK